MNDDVPFEEQTIGSNPKMALAIFLGGVLTLAGFYLWLDSSDRSGSSNPHRPLRVHEVNQVKDYLTSDQGKRLEIAKKYVEEWGYKFVGDPKKHESTYKIYMMKCLDQEAKNEAEESNLDDIVNLCIAAINLKVATGQ